MQEELHRSFVPWLINFLPPRIAILMLLYVHTTVKQLSKKIKEKKNGRWWKPEFLLLEWEFINKPGEGARIIHVAMN